MLFSATRIRLLQLYRSYKEGSIWVSKLFWISLVLIFVRLHKGSLRKIIVTMGDHNFMHVKMKGMELLGIITVG